MRTRLALLAAAALAFGCGTRGTLFTPALTPLPLVATAGAVVQVVPQTRRAVVVTPGQGAPHGLLLSPGARFAAAVPGTDVVGVLSGSAKAPKLDVVDVSTGAVTTLDTPGFFDRILFSADSRFGVLAYDATGVSGGLVARNLNEVGLWTLAAGTVQRLSLDTESLAPRTVVFGPTETARQLVAVTLDHGVALFDALHPEVAPRRISIVPQGSASESTVDEALFSADAHWLFLRASALDDVIVVELGAEVGQPVSASINFVSGGVGLADIEAPPPGFPDSVLAAYSTSRDAWLLDAHGIQDNAKRLAVPHAVDHVQLLSGTRALLWASNGTAVSAWDVADGRTGTLVLDGAYDAPVVLPAMDKALFPLPSTAASGPALSTVTVVPETNRLKLQLQGIQLSQRFGASAVDAAGQRLFFTVTNTNSVVTMDLHSLALAEVDLDAAVANLEYLPTGDWLVAVHAGDSYGDLTVVPAGTTDRAGAIRYSDFAFTGDLDRPGDPP